MPCTAASVISKAAPLQFPFLRVITKDILGLSKVILSPSSVRDGIQNGSSSRLSSKHFHLQHKGHYMFMLTAGHSHNSAPCSSNLNYWTFHKWAWASCRAATSTNIQAVEAPKTLPDGSSLLAGTIRAELDPQEVASMMGSLDDLKGLSDEHKHWACHTVPVKCLYPSMDESFYMVCD